MSTLAKRVVGSSSRMLVLSEKDVRKCLTMESCLQINRVALMSIASSKAAAARVGEGKGVVPSRLGLPGPPPPPPPPLTTTTTSTPDASIRTDNSNTAEDWTLFKPAAFYAHNETSTTTTAATTNSSTNNNDNNNNTTTTKPQNPKTPKPPVNGLLDNA